MPQSTSIVWFRHDLRLADHAPLEQACRDGSRIVPVFIDDREEVLHWPSGSATRWWLHHALESLQQSLASLGSRLIMRRGRALDVLRRLIAETGATAVYWGRRYEHDIVDRDTRVKTALRVDGITAESFNTSLLYEPWEISTKEKKPYQVFTPFWRACQAHGEPREPLEAPRAIASPPQWPRSDQLADWKLLPSIPWDTEMRATWKPGEAGAHERLAKFVQHGLREYGAERDRPDHDGVSRLSPYLHFGELSPRQVWHAALASQRDEPRQLETLRNDYLRQLVWREFAYHLLYHFPRTSDKPLRDKYAKFPWRDDRSSLRAWQRGLTGYPLVDAGMRQLWQTGWMHNRVRMVVASFLVKDLLISWQAGAQWFWDTLVDADRANNTLGWQWAAGCGADAAPYFRVFNPVTQSEKFDPQGAYIRRWVSELSRLSAPYIHQPWAAPPQVLEAAGVVLGQNYPRPLVDHAEARQRALTALKSIG